MQCISRSWPCCVTSKFKSSGEQDLVNVLSKLPDEPEMPFKRVIDGVVYRVAWKKQNKGKTALLVMRRNDKQILQLAGEAAQAPNAIRFFAYAVSKMPMTADKLAKMKIQWLMDRLAALL